MNKRTWALTGALVLGAGGAAFAATANASPFVADSASPARSAQEAHPAAAGKSDMRAAEEADRGPADLPDLSALPRVLHGEQVTEDPRTGRRVIHTEQYGTVTAASDSAVTVRSSDGVTWHWRLTADTVHLTGRSGARRASEVRAGDTVTVVGTRKGDTRTARLVTDPPESLGKDLRNRIEKRLHEALGDRTLDDLRHELRKKLRDLSDGEDGLGRLGDLLDGARSSGGAGAAAS